MDCCLVGLGCHCSLGPLSLCNINQPPLPLLPFTCQLNGGNPAGDLLPLFFLGRGRVTESIGAYNRWQLVKQQQQQQTRGSLETDEATGMLIDAMVNASAGLLPLPQRNVSISAGSGAALASARLNSAWPPSRLLEGFHLQADPNVPIMHVTVAGSRAPLFMSSLMPAQPIARAPISSSRLTQPEHSAADEPSSQPIQMQVFRSIPLH